MTTTLSRALSRAAASFSTSAAATPAAFPVKQVTRTNFAAELAELWKQVRAADFVAIDLEMTGVTSSAWRECFEFDRSDVRYLKVKDSAEKFAVCQVGVVPFRWDPYRNTFVAHPHNFYVFPRQELTSVDSSSYEFLWQSGSIDFLASYQFDFNACIRDGVSYLSRRQEHEAMEHLNSEYKDESCNLEKQPKDVPILSIADTLFSERMKKRFSEWRDWLLKSSSKEFQFQGNSNDFRQQFHIRFFNMRPTISLNGFSTHELRLIESIVWKDFKDLCYVNVAGDNGSSEQLVVFTESKEDKKLLMKELNGGGLEIEKKKIQNAIGLRHVIDLLSSEKKLIVGHNCFLDMAHIYSKFIGPLPSTAEEFVSSVNQHFPYIIDTKILMNTHHLLQQRMRKSKTSLSSAFATLCPHISVDFEQEVLPLDFRVNVEIEVDKKRVSLWSSGAKHEAGYDAFMTGCIFAQICSHAGVDFKLHSRFENLAFHEKLSKHINRLYLSWTNADIIDLCTGLKVPEPLELINRFSNTTFDNLVLIWGCPAKLKLKDVKQCLAKAFGSTSVLSVYQLDDTAVFVQFANTDLVSSFLSLKKKLGADIDQTLSFNSIAQLFDGDTHAATYQTYKGICSSALSKETFAEQAESLGYNWKPAKVVEHDVPVNKRSGDKTEPDLETVSESDEEINLSGEKNSKSFYTEQETRLVTSSNL